MNTSRSDRLFERAQSLIPGGVNSPVRAFRAVGRSPLFIAHGSGSRIYDVDGNEFIDYVGSWGPLILGHAHPKVIEAIRSAAGNGTSYGAPTQREIQLAELVRSFMPGIEMLRMVNSGTEATMSAARLARAYTGRTKIVKFAGCYHGHADEFLIKAGSGATTLGVPDSPGVPALYASESLNATYNDPKSVEDLVRATKQAGESIAAIIVEPVAGNMGVVPPAAGFLEGLRAIADREGIVLIFDEVMTGFRVARGGAQELYRVRPDLTTFGKVIGGGLPVGAYGGRREIMELVAPCGPVYQAGTLSGNPLAMAAGIETLRVISQEDSFYEDLEKHSAKLALGLRSAAADEGVPVRINRVGSMLTIFFNEGEVTDYASALRSDVKRFGGYFRGMLEGGVYLPPSQFEAFFVSAVHSDGDLDRTIEVHRASLRGLAARNRPSTHV